MKKRILSLLLSLILCLSFLPAAYAAPAAEEDGTVQTETAAPAEAPAPDQPEALTPPAELPAASVIDSGSCGSSVVWKLYDDGKLLITGSGLMSNYAAGGAPWYSRRASITALEVGSGVTSIGAYAFTDLTSLKKVTLADSITSIGNYAFAHCKGITHMPLPGKLTSIGDSAFNDCTSLESMVLPKTVTAVGNDAFYGDSALTGLFFTGDAPTFGTRVLYNDSVTVYYPTANTTWTAAVRAETYGANGISWTAIKTGSVGRIELAGGVKPVTGAIPDASGIYLANVNCGVELISAEWRNGRSSTAAQVVQGGEYPYLYVTVRAFDGCTISGTSYVVHPQFGSYNSGYSSIYSGKTGTFYCSLNRLDSTLDYTVDLSANGTATVTDAYLARAILNDLGKSASSAQTTGAVTAYDFNGDNNTDLTVENKSSGSAYKLVLTQQTGLLMMLAGGYNETLTIRNSESNQLAAIANGVPFYQKLVILPKCATLTLKGNGGRFMDGSTTLKITLRANGDIPSWTLEEYGLTDFSSAGFRSGYLPLRLAATSGGADPMELTELYNATFSKDTTLYMMWGKSVKLTLNANGGQFILPGSNEVIEAGTEMSVQVPAGFKLMAGGIGQSIVRSGYTVKTLSTDKAGAKPVSLDENGYFAMPAADTTYYVQWERPDEPVILKSSGSWYTSAVTGENELAVGETLDLYCFAAGKGITYQWQYNSDGSENWHNSTMTGAKTTRMSVPVTAARDGYQYRCKVTDSSGNTVLSNVVTLHCCIDFYGPVPDVYGAVGDTAVFTVPVSGAASYQWQYSSDGGNNWYDSTMTGAKTATLSVPVTAARDYYEYRCRVTFVDGSSDVSYPGRLIVTDKFIDKVDLDLSFLHDGITSEDVFFHLMENFVGSYCMAAGPESLIRIPAGMEAYVDHMSPEELVDELGHSYGSLCLVPGEYIMVIGLAGIDKEVENPYEFMSDPGQETATESAPGLDELLRQSSEARRGTRMAYDPHDFYQFRWDKMKVTVNGKAMQEGTDWIRHNSYGEEYLVLVYRFTVKDETARIVADPRNAAGSVGESVTFAVEAAGTAVAYQWQYCAAGSTTWHNSSAEGANTPMLNVDVTSARNGQQYRCVISDYKGNTATSKAAALTVSDKPVIQTQPKSVTAGVGTDVTFTVSAAGRMPWVLSYQWQYRTSSTGTWKDSGATGCHTPTLHIQATAARNGYQYRCKVTDFQKEVTVTSSAATLTVAAKPAVTTQPHNISATIGDTAVFKVAASGTGLTYQWQYYTGSKWINSGLTGNKTASLSVPVTVARNGQKYRCVVTDANGATVTSSTAVLKVKTKITAQPKTVTAPIGDTAKFTVTATGVGLTYQWQYYTGSKWVSSGFTGNKTASLSVPVTAARNGQKYRCVITNANGVTTTSSVGVLKVETVITAQPKSVTATAGSTAKFTVTATGAGLTYQWQYYTGSNWVDSSLTGNKTATLSVGATTARNGQKYRCVITDANGVTTTSSTATLTVK